MDATSPSLLTFADGAAVVATAATMGALAGVRDIAIAHPPAASINHPETLLLHNLDVILPDVPTLLAEGVDRAGTKLSVAGGEGWGGFMRPIVHNRQNKAPCKTAESNAIAPLEAVTADVPTPSFIQIQLSSDVFLCIHAAHRTSSQRHKRCAFVPSPPPPLRAPISIKSQLHNMLFS